MSVSQLVIDYVVICDRRGEMLDFAGFVVLWTVANQVAKELVRDGFEAGPADGGVGSARTTFR